MHWLAAWFVRNPVAANLLMALILLAGLLTVSGMRIESFPRVPPRSISISVVYPGATATQVSQGVTEKIEQALEGLPGVRRTFSLSVEGFSSVVVERRTGYDLQRLLEDAKIRVDGIVGLPLAAERPSITRDEFSVFGLIVQVTGDVDEQTLQQACRLVEDELLTHPQISNLEVFGKRPFEVSLEVDNALLERHGLTLQHVRQAVESNSLDYRAGALDSDGQRILLRGDGKAFYREDFADIPLLTLPSGEILRMRDVATVRDGFEQDIVHARFNGKPSIGLIVNTTRMSNLLDVREAVDEVLATARPQLPDAIELDVWADSAEYIQDRLSLLRTNAWQGLLLIVVLLTLFLDWRLALWVALGIPIAVAGTLALMGERFLGHSLNDITTFGLIIVLGILVDDAIVVGESIYESRQGSKDGVTAAISGVQRVATPTAFGAMTTIAAFFPLLLIDNDIARVFAGFSVIVITAVSMSFVESKFILPAHLASVPPGDRGGRSRLSRAWARVRGAIDRGFEILVRTVYRRALGRVLQHRYAALLLLSALAIFGIGLMIKGTIEMVFFPEVPGNTITVTVAMDPSSPEALTLRGAERLEAAAEVVNRRLADERGLSAPPIAKVMVALAGRREIEAYGELTPEAMNTVGTTAVLNAWRAELGALEGVEDIRFSGSFETGGGFALQIIGRDEAALAEAVSAVSERLAAVAGVHDVRSDLQGGQPEIHLRLKPEARHLGLTLADLAIQIGDGFGGLEVQRMQRADDEVKVFVRYEEERRRSLHEVLTSKVVTPDGRWVMLSSVAELDSSAGASAILRRDGKRAATLEATLDKTVTGAADVMRAIEDVLEQVPERWPGLEVRRGGELEEMGEVQDGMVKASIFIAALIFTLLAIPLRSYSKPVVIMSVVPFAFMGAAFGHLAMDLPLSILSFFGMLAATGVVVNDSLVMVSRYGQLRDDGMPLAEALVEAGCSRFRAIFLTTVTTVSGLMPLMLETSEQAQYLIPAAVSLAFAELLATPVALFLVPIMLHVLHDLRTLLGNAEPQ
ncbi:MAG: efflux RND transporter permease subunit [Acidobacteriota bacterium]